MELCSLLSLLGAAVSTYLLLRPLVKEIVTARDVVFPTWCDGLFPVRGRWLRHLIALLVTLFLAPLAFVTTLWLLYNLLLLPITLLFMLDQRLG